MTGAQQFVLGLVYQAGPNRIIKTGADGARDYFTDEQLEKAAWGFLGSDMLVGVDHVDDTEGHAVIKESYIYRGPDWVMKDVRGDEVVIKSGDWLAGALLDDTAWGMAEDGKLTGWSFEGKGKRIRKAVAPTPIETVRFSPDTLRKLADFLEGITA